MVIGVVARRAGDLQADRGRRRPSRSISIRRTCRDTRCAPRCACSPRWPLSLLFTFTYAPLAAKSRRAGLMLIPLLDVLQSVPILGFLSFTTAFFMSLFPGSVLGLELAAIFAIFTEPSLEHGVQLLPVADHRARAIWRRRPAASI